jgi:hypothetical protein
VLDFATSVGLVAKGGAEAGPGVVWEESGPPDMVPIGEVDGAAGGGTDTTIGGEAASAAGTDREMEEGSNRAAAGRPAGARLLAACGGPAGGRAEGVAAAAPWAWSCTQDAAGSRSSVSDSRVGIVSNSGLSIICNREDVNSVQLKQVSSTHTGTLPAASQSKNRFSAHSGRQVDREQIAVAYCEQHTQEDVRSMQLQNVSSTSWKK